ncbi:Auxin response factor 4 [Linum perenne]
MEIDLNHAVTEVEKNAFPSVAAAAAASNNNNNNIINDKNKNKNSNNGDSSSYSSCSSNSSDSPMASSIYLELWHACAGPLTSLPKKGSVVVYFPQGHLEQLSSSPLFSPLEMRTFDLHPQIFCKVVNLHLLANKENDEVYAQLSLLPLPELVSAVDEDGGDDSPPARSTPHMFCKTLTASDTSTHGGFSVPRRAAEDCFPPLDYNQQRPSQELVAKDLHGVEWRFRHIYRGQPRRHLLTTGWSIFVSQKRLVFGDAVLFLRGDNGELRLGIRRAIRPRNGIPDAVIQKQNSYPSVLSLVANATTSKSVFNVVYSPRASHAEFVVSYQKYMKSMTNLICSGTRFRMKFEMDDSPERRCSGVVTGVGDFDPYRWPNSKWKCLMVKWDEDIVADNQERVSPWEIDPSVSLPPLSIQPSSRMKKLRTSLQLNLPETPDAGGSGCLDFEESIIRPSKVLQGQENVGYVSHLFGREAVNHPPDFEVRAPALQNRMSAGTPKRNIGEVPRANPPAIYPGFVESDRFPKVLQGQEICQLSSLSGKGDLNFGAWGNPSLGCSSLNMYPAPRPNNFYPLVPDSQRSLYFPYGDVYKTGQEPGTHSYATNFNRGTLQFSASPVQIGDAVVKLKHLSEHEPQQSSTVSPALEISLGNQKDESFTGNASGCKLFGFSLTAEAVQATSSQNSGKRSCTKVHKQGSLVGRAIDLSRLNSYDDLLIELERLFSMEGLLRDAEKGWRILYTDSENDVMVVGDDPWHEFCTVASKIHIHTKEEVEKMTIGMTGDDTQSCLDQGTVAMEASKSSSVGQPDSSSTVAKV